MYEQDNLDSISITIKRVNKPVDSSIGTFNPSTSLPPLDSLLENDYNNLPNIIVGIVHKLESTLPIEDLYRGFLELSSQEKQLNFLRLLNLEKKFNILKLLSLEHLEQGINFLIKLNDLEQLFDKTIQTFSDILTVLPYTTPDHPNYSEQLQLKFTFLDNFNTRYLQDIIKTSGNFIGILNVLPKDCWSYFLIKFDKKFLQKKIIYFGDARFILDNWPENNLEHINDAANHKKIINFRIFLNKKLQHQSNTLFSSSSKLNKYKIPLTFRKPSSSGTSSCSSVIVVENCVQNQNDMYRDILHTHRSYGP